MKSVRVDEAYQKGYAYTLVCPPGKDFQEGFEPDLTPAQMLALGIFGGDYFQETPREFPADWFKGVRFSGTGKADPGINFFKVNASQPLSAWQKKGWIYFEDPKGWFLWYCRYYMGRRIPEEDARQIKRWKAMRRHITQLQNSCAPGDITCLSLIHI